MRKYGVVSVITKKKKSNYYIMLSEVFWVAFITTISGMIIKLCSMAYKSKCKEASICCLKIIRDTEAEEKEE